ncbi:hypothetical protein BH10PSE6_BH10PSE6_24090 [soil metagenome]
MHVPRFRAKEVTDRLSPSMRSQMIFNVATMGTASRAPATPHIQYQKIRAMITTTGLSVNCRASNIGVIASASARWISRKMPTGNRAGHTSSKVVKPTNARRMPAATGPRMGT